MHKFVIDNILFLKITVNFSTDKNPAKERIRCAMGCMIDDGAFLQLVPVRPEVANHKVCKTV